MDLCSTAINNNQQLVRTTSMHVRGQKDLSVFLNLMLDTAYTVGTYLYIGECSGIKVVLILGLTPFLESRDKY